VVTRVGRELEEGRDSTRGVGRTEGRAELVEGREIPLRGEALIEGRLSERGAETDGIRGAVTLVLPRAELGRATREA